MPIELRPATIRLLDDALKGKFDQLLVYKLDRLGRETLLILKAVDELKRRGVRVRSMTEEFDSATATGDLMLTLLSGFASHERDVIRERSVAGTNRLALTGAWMGGVAPYGYDLLPENRMKLNMISYEKGEEGCRRVNIPKRRFWERCSS